MMMMMSRHNQIA